MRIEVTRVWLDDHSVYIQTGQGFVKSVPFSDFPLLRNATAEQRADFEYGQFGIRWKELDEDLSFEGFFSKEELELISDLKTVFEIVPTSYIAKRFFGRSRSWLTNKLKGNLSNGKPSKFSDNEYQILINALEKISSEISIASKELRQIATGTPCPH